MCISTCVERQTAKSKPIRLRDELPKMKELEAEVGIQGQIFSRMILHLDLLLLFASCQDQMENVSSFIPVVHRREREND